MKKRILIITLIGLSFGIKAQNNFPTNGNVGIGTTNTGNGLLTLNGNNTNLLRLENDEFGNEAMLRFRSKSTTGGTLHSDISLYATGSNQGYLGFKVPHNNTANSGYDMVINHNGNVGIGTTTPFLGTANYGLHINKGTHSSILFNNPTSGSGGIIQTSDGKQRIFIGANLYDDQNGSWSSFQTGKGSAGISMIADEGGRGTYIDFITSQSDGHYNRSMRILGNGNVGIGTANPGSWKLAVNGQIRAKEIKVETGWSDFVFENNYRLPTLKEVEKHIKEKGHLKDIPSAKEVEKNGIYLGEMDSKLLQKIEELTLYTIGQQKEIENFKKQKYRIDKLEKENKSLKTMNSKLLELQKRLEKLENK
jgi:hypothetical protein